MISKKKKTTTDDLAVMINRGFEQTREDFKQVDKRLGSLENGQEEIKLSLNNVAYRFELVELQKRVERLEKKIA